MKTSELIRRAGQRFVQVWVEGQVSVWYSLRLDRWVVISKGRGNQEQATWTNDEAIASELTGGQWIRGSEAKKQEAISVNGQYVLPW